MPFIISFGVYFRKSLKGTELGHAESRIHKILSTVEVVMCNKNLKLKNPLKVNRPLEFIEAPSF